MAPGLKAGPVTRVCHVCGRQYGLSSFEIHLKQCKKLWIQQEELKPMNERRPVPKTPPVLGDTGGGEESGGSSRGMSRDEVEALNRAAQEAFNVHGMESCEFCGRTFAEGRLAIHNKSCRADTVAKKVTDGAAPRNKKDTGVEYGRVRPRTGASSVEKTSSIGGGSERLATSSTQQRPSSPIQQQSTTPGVEARALSGSLASNRKRIPTGDGGASSRQQIQSPLEQTVDVESMRRDLRSKDAGVISVIQAKLDRWEATTLAMLQEIQDLKSVFAELSST